MKKPILCLLTLLGGANSLLAGAVTPEIGASSAVAALSLLMGGLVIVKTRRRK